MVVVIEPPSTGPASPPLPAALSASGFGKRYRRRGPWAVRDVDLSLPAGSVTALVGPNGAGKSTLLRAWVGLERPSAGRVAVWGIDPWRDRPAALERVGYVGQGSPLYRELSVAGHLALTAACRRTSEGRGPSGP